MAKRDFLTADCRGAERSAAMREEKLLQLAGERNMREGQENGNIQREIKGVKTKAVFKREEGGR